MSSYSLVFQTIHQANRLPRVGTRVATILDRPLVEVYAILTLPGFVLRNHLPLTEAQTLQEALLQAGCICSLQAEPDDPDLPDADAALDLEWRSTLPLMIAATMVLAILLAWLMGWPA